MKDMIHVSGNKPAKAVASGFLTTAGIYRRNLADGNLAMLHNYVCCSIIKQVYFQLEITMSFSRSESLVISITVHPFLCHLYTHVLVRG